MNSTNVNWLKSDFSHRSDLRVEFDWFVVFFFFFSFEELITSRFLRQNIPESVALLSSQIVELAREGGYNVAMLMDLGRSLLGTNQVIPGVAEVLDEVQVK